MYIKYFFLFFIFIFSAHAMEKSPSAEKQALKRQRLSQPADQLPQPNKRKLDEQEFLASLPRTPVVKYYCSCLSNPELLPTNRAMIFSALGDHLKDQKRLLEALQSYIRAINVKNADGTDALDGDTRTITLSNYAKLNKKYQNVRRQLQMILNQRGHQRP